MNQEKMGKFISELRKEKGLTQKDIGDKLNISDNSVSKWERGINAPDIYYLGPLSEMLGVSIKELLMGERKKPKRQKSENRKKILEVKSLTKKIHKKEILKNISVDLYEGEIVGLVGPNGAGKTTFMKCILNLYPNIQGSIQINGFDLHKDFEKAMEKVGCIVNEANMYDYLTGMDHIRLTCLLHNIKDKKYAMELVRKFKMNTFINKKVKSYSLGMRQRLGLILALMIKPKILLLDEPTNGLDPLGMKELRDILKNISEQNNTTILISSHLLYEIETICTRILILDNGYMIDDIDIEDIHNQEKTLEEEYLVVTSGSQNQIGGEL